MGKMKAMNTVEQYPEVCVPKNRRAKLKVETQTKEQSLAAFHFSDVTAPDRGAGSSRDMKEQRHPTTLDGELNGRVRPQKRTCTAMTKHAEHITPDLGHALGLALDGKPERKLEIDVEKYQAYLDDPDLSDDQKEQIVLAVFQIMSAFVQLGYGIHPLQEVCGQVEGMVDCAAGADSNGPTAPQKTLNKEFERAAEALPAEAQERRSP